jgi:hypothetical protein
MLLMCCAFVLPAQPPGQFNNWKFDSLRKKNGKTLQGLVEKETGTEVSFIYVARSPGKPTAVFHTTIPKTDIESIDRLGTEERAQLEARLASLAREKKLSRDLDVKPAPWGKEGAPGFSYTSSHFVLLSNAREEIVRCVAARLEQVYGAYARFLPPRRSDAAPTQILLVQPLSAYKQILREQNRDLLNPAFYDPARNQIIWACELQHLIEERDHEREWARQLRERLREQEAQWAKSNKGPMPADLRRKLDGDWKEIEKTGYANEGIFEKGRQRFFQILYHEAFHAYLANFVYPCNSETLPRWLNEGLAQIFETAIIEAGELEISRPDGERLVRAKEADRCGELVKLEDLLRSGPRDFLVGHASDQQLSNRYYLSAWALAFYLTFERTKIDLPELDRYVQALKAGTEPCKAFENFVGQPLAEFEKSFHEYLQGLRADGSVVKSVPVKKANQSH